MGEPEVIRKHCEPRPSVRKEINKVTLQGTVTSKVRVKKLKSSTLSCVFKVRSRETFKTRGRTNWHDNEIIIEALGNQAAKAQKIIRVGGDYIFDGYLRTDIIQKGGTTFRRMRVRVYHIEEL